MHSQPWQVLALLSTAAPAARPEKPVRFIIPFPRWGRLDMRLRDGRALTHTVQHMHSTHRNPLTRGDFSAKFRSNAGDMLPAEVVEEVISGLLELEKCANIAPLFARLDQS